MSGIWKKGTANRVGIDLGKTDVYGVASDTFQAGYFDSDNNYTAISGLTEQIKSVEANSCKANGATSKGSLDIPVEDTDDNNKVANFKKGDVIKVKDKDIYFYVENVDTNNNVITARRPISGDIADGDELDRVGNTGLYATNVTIDNVGVYFVVISNPTIGLLNRSAKIEVAEHTDEDIYTQMEIIGNVINDVNTKIDSIDGIDGIVIA